MLFSLSIQPWRNLLYVTMAQFLHLLSPTVASAEIINPQFNKLLPDITFLMQMSFFFWAIFFESLLRFLERVQNPVAQQHRSTPLCSISVGCEQKEEH